MRVDKTSADLPNSTRINCEIFHNSTDNLTPILMRVDKAYLTIHPPCAQTYLRRGTSDPEKQFFLNARRQYFYARSICYDLYAMTYMPCAQTPHHTMIHIPCAQTQHSTLSCYIILLHYPSAYARRQCVVCSMQYVVCMCMYADHSTWHVY